MFSNPSHRQFMNMVNAYFDRPLLQKVKDEGDTSVYMCRLSSLLLKEHRYLVAIITMDQEPIGAIQPLSDLSWKYFQARVLEGDMYAGIIQHAYVTKAEKATNWSVVKIKSTSQYSIFQDEQSRFPVEITLLHTANDEYEYPSRGTFASCLETFQTMIRFTEY